MGKNVTVWGPDQGSIVLTAALLNQILGGQSASIVSTPISTAGAGVLTAAALIGGQIGRTGPVAAYTDTTATAAAIVTALGGFQLGQTFTTVIKNATAFVQTLGAGAGVTLPAGAVIPAQSAGSYFGTVGGTVASPTVTFTHRTTGAIYIPANVVDEQAIALVTVGAGAITAAGLNAGVTNRGGTQIAAFTDTTPTAAAVIAGISAFVVIGSAVEWTYLNNTVFPATLAGGDGSITISGQTIIPANSWAKYLISYTAAGTVVMRCVGQGYFPKSGTFVCNQTTPVTVADASVTAGSAITITLKTVGGTVGAIPHVATITPGTGFTVVGVASDTSTYNYEIRG